MMLKYHQILLVLFVVAGLASAESRSWQAIKSEARGQTVSWFMWGGFPAANAYVNGYVANQVQTRFDITLKQVPVQDIAEVVSKLVVEKQAGRTTGQVDLMWINGENFRTCKQYELLYGPFAERLPNRRYVDTSDPAIQNDFGEPVEGLESPWGSAQFVMIYDSTRTPKPPRTVVALLQWIRDHPGRFTYPAPPDFTGSAFLRHIFYHVAGPDSLWQHNYDNRAFRDAASQTYALLREQKPHLWRNGQTFPESPLRLSQMFADGEVDFSMSYHPAEASQMIQDGLLPPSTRTYVFEGGSIANTHFVAIPFNASAPAAAMVVANFLLSPEAQLHKADSRVWGDLPVIDFSLLSPAWQQKFTELPRGIATLPYNELQRRQLQEPTSDILIELEQGWERHVLRTR